MKDRIFKLLVAGYSPAEVAKIVGCSPGYISQLLKDEEFKNSVQAAFVESHSNVSEEEEFDQRYKKLEHKLLTSIEEGLGEASLGEKIRALETINKRSDSIHLRKNPVQQSPQIGVTVVNLQLPAHAVKNMGPAVEVNANNEIIAINGKALAPMSSDGVKNIFSQLQERKQLEAAQAQIVEEI